MADRTQKKKDVSGKKTEDTLAGDLDGEKIMALHRALGILGYTIPVAETSISLFGDETLNALKDFQQKNKLTPSGVIDAQTMTLFNKKMVERKIPVDPAKKDLGIPLALNASGVEVKDLQNGLKKLGYAIPKQEMDNQSFSTGTLVALESLQTKNNIPVTGIVDKATSAILKAGLANGNTQNNNDRVS